MKKAAFIGSAILILIIGAFAQSKKRPLETTPMADGDDSKATEAG
jgi:hypothetical protein